MNALWNKKSLEHPANNIWIADRGAIDFESFSSALDNAIKDLESQNTLHTEAAILSRLIYRMKSKFRSDKGLKNMEKVNRALLNYLEIQLHKEYKDLKKYIEIDGLLVNLPTKQMIEYLLVRTQGFAKLMARVECVARLAAEFFRVRISIGHAWTVSVIAYAVISRVWFLARFLLKRCCSWYNGVREHLDDFKRIGPAWLPQDYELPNDLKAWLDLPWIDRASDSVPLRDDGKETIFGLIKAQDEDTCGLNFEEEEIVEEEEKERSKPIIDGFHNTRVIKTVEEEKVSSETKYGVTFLNDDVGMSIDREAYAAEKRIKNEEKLIEGKKESETISQNVEKASKKRKVKKLEASTTDDTASPVPVKKKKNNSDDMNATIVKKLERIKDEGSFEASNNDSAGIKIGKLKKIKGKKKVKLTTSYSHEENKLTNLGEIKTRDDLAIFLSKDCHPSLDKLQWNMLMKTIKKFLVKLDKFEENSNEKKENNILKKINREINNWIR